MSADTSKLQAAAIRELCKPLRLPAVAAQATRLAEQAAKEKQSPLSFLEALLSAEVEEREQNAVARRIKEAHFPKVKTLDEFNFQEAQHLPVTNTSSGRGRIHRENGTGPVSGRHRDGKDSPGDCAGSGGVPAEETSAVHDRGGDGQ
jgi:hypothetical protein